MSTWTTDELERIAGVDEVQVAPRRTDGSGEEHRAWTDMKGLPAWPAALNA